MSAFADRALAARAEWNATLARSRALGADRDTLTDAMHDVARSVDPLAGVLEPVTFAAVCDALVAALARLVAAGRWTAHSPARYTALEVVPRTPRWLASAPGPTVAALLDAAHAVAGGPGPRGDLDAWTTRVLAAARLAPERGGATDAADVRSAALVAAWRGGLVRYRRAALDAAAFLPEPLARAVLSLPATPSGPPGPDLPDAGTVGEVLARHRADPWWWPGTLVHPGPVLAGRFGGFRGFGGTWLTPPRVLGPDPAHPGLRWELGTPGGDGADGLDGQDERWVLVADVHGSVVGRRSGPHPPAVHGRGEPSFPGLDEVSGVSAVDLPSARVTLISRTRSYDALLLREAR